MTVHTGQTVAPASPETRVGGRGPRRVRVLRGQLVPLIPVVALIALWMVWIPATGAYFQNAWYPSALGAAALLGVMLIARVGPLPRNRAARVAILSFAALVAWSYLSILWAGSPASALDASNRLLLYLVVGWTFAIIPWTPATQAAALAAWSVGVAVFCATGLIEATSASNLNPFFVGFRYARPLQYSNATAALAVMGAWPALILSSRRELPAAARAVLLAIATFLVEFALLPQSRAAVLGLALAAAVVIVVGSDRLRLLPRMAVVGGGIAIAVPKTVAVDDALNAGNRVGPPLAHAANAMLFTSIAALIIGVLLAFADGRVRWAPLRGRRLPRLGRRGRLALAAAAVIALGAGGAAAAPGLSHVIHTVIKQGHSDAGTGSTRLLSTAPEERFDYARVALKLFSEEPILGVGAGNFGRRYDPLKQFQKHSQYTHDVALRAMSETGIVGLGLLLAVVGSLTLGLVRARRELPGLGGACAVAALAVAAYFLIHDSFDWLDEFPALAAPALAFSLGAIAMRGGEPRATARPRTRAWHIGAAVAAVGACAAVLLALVPAYLETRYVERALKTFRARPAGAYADLRRATELNPLSPDPYTTKGTISLVLGNYALARRSFEQSIAKEDDWYPRLELALIDAHYGQFQAASSELDNAARLDVDDPILSEAREEIGNRTRIQPITFDRHLVGGVQTQLFAPQGIKK